VDTGSHRALARLVARAKSVPDVLAVILFGSRARADVTLESDVDVCLVLGAEPRSDLAGAHKRLAYLGDADVDLTVFQQLPLYVRSRVLKEGTILFVRDEDALYALAARTARAFEAFRHIYRQYLDQVSRD
jgi:predicted nucleotidyltransferase